MNRSSFAYKQLKPSEQPTTLAKRRPSITPKDETASVCSGRIKSVLQRNSLQNICEVTQDPNESEDFLTYLQPSTFFPEKWNTITVSKQELETEWKRHSAVVDELKVLKERTEDSDDSLTLSSISPYYFDENFRLKGALQNIAGMDAKDSNEYMIKFQKELESFLTCIENQLCKRVLEKGEMIRASLLQVEEVQGNLVALLYQLQDIRSQIEQVKLCSCEGMNSIEETFRALDIANSVAEKSEEISEITQAPKNIHILLGSSDYLGAMNSIEQVQHELRNNLQSFRCLESIEKQLNATFDDTIQAMQQDFVGCLEELMSEWTTSQIQSDIPWEQSVREDVESLSTAATNSVLSSLIVAAFRFRKLEPLVKSFVDRHFDLLLQNTEYIGEEASKVTCLEDRRELVEQLLNTCKWHLHRVAIVFGLVNGLVNPLKGQDSHVDSLTESVTTERHSTWEKYSPQAFTTDIRNHFIEDATERLSEACRLVLPDPSQYVDTEFRKESWTEEQLVNLEHFAIIFAQLETFSEQVVNIFLCGFGTVSGLRSLTLDSCRGFFQKLHKVSWNGLESMLKEEKWNAVDTIPDSLVSYVEELRRIPLNGGLDRRSVLVASSEKSSAPPREDFIQLDEEELYPKRDGNSVLHDDETDNQSPYSM
eukprot:jgi/Galph1/5104/GphlegSOOS_G3790.1